METASVFYKSCLGEVAKYLWGGLVCGVIDAPLYLQLSLYRAGAHLPGHSMYDHH